MSCNKDPDPTIGQSVTAPALRPATSPTDSPEAAYPAPSVEGIEPAYPGPPATSTASAYPVPEASPTPLPITGASQPTATRTASADTFLPLIQIEAADPTSESPTVAVTEPAFPLDFEAIRAQLNASGQELAHVKIGFHVTLMDDATMESLFAYLRILDSAGVPFFLKSASNAEPLLFAQELRAASGVAHTLVYRSTNWDVPNYDASPQASAQLHWQRHRDAFPPELDPSVVWIETLNEVDKNRADWLASFALHTAELTLADGYRWAAFGWASGEPEPEHWQSPAMLEFLRLAGENPGRLAVALPEYSFISDDIGHDYPYKIGRFQELFRIADQYHIPRPTVLITEWGWTYDSIPPADQAMRDISWAAELYAPFPQIKGAAIWNLGLLGCCSSELSEKVESLLNPLTNYSISHYTAVPLPPSQAAPDPEPYHP